MKSKQMKKNKIVITLSGGMDSAVLLYKAAEEFNEVHTVTFDYGQRHDRELIAAERRAGTITRRPINYTNNSVNKPV